MYRTICITQIKRADLTALVKHVNFEAGIDRLVIIPSGTIRCRRRRIAPARIRCPLALYAPGKVAWSTGKPVKPVMFPAGKIIIVNINAVRIIAATVKTIVVLVGVSLKK